MASQAALELVLKLVDEASDELRRVQKELDDTGDAAKKAEKHGQGMFRGMATVAGGFLAANVLGRIAEGFGGLTNAMIGGNAEFERYETQFGVLLGSADAAKERLAELAAFGAATPFELPEVVRADKILQGFGLHSEEAAKQFGFAGEEIRRIAGDTAAGSGAAFEEMTLLLGKFSTGATGEALARMAELGITSRAELKKMGLEFSKAGELLSPLPEAMNVVLQMMNDKYGGMMDAQSRTFEGMMSNLRDWVGATLREIGQPIFEILRDKLKELLAFLGKPETKAAIKAFAEGLADAAKTLLDIAGFIINNARPALIALGVATTVYAATQLPAMVLALTTATGALYAKAAALTASLGPLALVAAAIFGVVKAWDSYNEKIETATTKLLESRKWWNDNTKALENYEQQSAAVKTTLKGQADAIQETRQAIQDEIASLAARKNVGLVTDEQYYAEMDAINARADVLRQSTNAMEVDIRRLNDTSYDNIERMRGMRAAGTEAAAGLEEVGNAAKLTDDELDKLADELGKIHEEGTKALSGLIDLSADYFTTEENQVTEHNTRVSDLTTDHEEKLKDLRKSYREATTVKEKEELAIRIQQEKDSYTEKIAAENQAHIDGEAQRAGAYARELIAQQQHLGTMLINHITVWGQMNSIPPEQIGQMVAAVTEKYGVMEAATSRSFGIQTEITNIWARTGQQNMTVMTDLMGRVQQKTADWDKANQSLVDYYSTTFKQQLDDGMITIDQYKAKLLSIPSRIQTDLSIRYTSDSGADPVARTRGGPMEMRASGGPVGFGQAYMVGETGPELFVPRADGTILNPSMTRQALGGGGRSTRVEVNLNGSFVVDSDDRMQQMAAMIESNIIRRMQEEDDRALDEIMGTGVA